MRKKVAILLPWLKMGGTNKVALRFADELCKYCDVTLILSSREGELMHEIPSGISVVYDEFVSFKKLFTDDLKHLRVRRVVRDVIYYINIRRGRDDIDNFRYYASRQKPIEGEYDCAVSYHGQSPERLVNLLYRTRAEKKAVWIHGEMSFSQSALDKMAKYYSRVDKFFFVSRATQDAFARLIPFDESRATVYVNPLDAGAIRQAACERACDELSPEFTNILTVGRLSREKGVDMIPRITKILLSRGHRVRWYVVGDGDCRGELCRLIKENGVEDSVFLLGVKLNPYVYMKNCDIYVQPSYTEGYSTTVCEAGVLGCAIVATAQSGGIREQITHGKDGLIADAAPCSIADAAEQLIRSPRLRRQFGDEIQKKNFEGKGEIEKFLDFCGIPAEPFTTMRSPNDDFGNSTDVQF